MGVGGRLWCYPWGAPRCRLRRPRYAVPLPFELRRRGEGGRGRCGPFVSFWSARVGVGGCTADGPCGVRRAVQGPGGWAGQGEGSERRPRPDPLGALVRGCPIGRRGALCHCAWPAVWLPGPRPGRRTERGPRWRRGHCDAIIGALRGGGGACYRRHCVVSLACGLCAVAVGTSGIERAPAWGGGGGARGGLLARRGCPGQPHWLCCLRHLRAQLYPPLGGSVWSHRRPQGAPH